MQLNLNQARQLLALFGGEDADVTVVFDPKGHNGAGVYAWLTDYPDEGSVFLDPCQANSSEEQSR